MFSQQAGCLPSLQRDDSQALQTDSQVLPCSVEVQFSKHSKHSSTGSFGEFTGSSEAEEPHIRHGSLQAVPEYHTDSPQGEEYLPPSTVVVDGCLACTL